MNVIEMLDRPIHRQRFRLMAHGKTAQRRRKARKWLEETYVETVN
ncbi:MAG TPA: hypothetical protein VJ810_34230 [Blastocatellia bacterium]|nr:hypothetical protein [Blastocatellia bacterium]